MITIPSNLLIKILVPAVVVLLSALFFDIFQLMKARTFNQALAEQDYYTAQSGESDYAIIAQAYLAQLEGDINRAQSIYSQLLSHDSSEIRELAMFNLADIFFRQAVKLELSDQPDTRIPLMELAKENYRLILRNNPGHWKSRFNLARALQILPDAEIRPQDEDDIMPERSPSAPVETIGYERLP